MTKVKKYRQISSAKKRIKNFTQFSWQCACTLGVIPTVVTPKEEPRHVHDLEPDVEDDPSTKFYKARLRRRSSFTEGGGTPPIYNFDTWSREHYGASFDRRKAAKARFERLQMRHRDHTFMMQNEIILFSMILIICTITYLKFMAESAYDTPKSITKTSSSNSDNDGKAQQQQRTTEPPSQKWMNKNDLSIYRMSNKLYHKLYPGYFSL